MIDLHETDVDGVRCFWVNSNRPTLAASLVFRAGIVDEPFHRHGWIHLLEHLCLHGRAGGTLSVNGSVSPLVTTFDLHGQVEDVVERLGAITRWLAAPDPNDLEREINVLRAESRTRGGAAADALVWRYGSHGPGLAGIEEFGLARVDPGELSAWAGEFFTSSNAALALDGPPPAGLALDLAPGSARRLIPSAIPCENDLPGLYVVPEGLVVSGTARRSTEAMVLPPVLERLLRERMRDREGASYAPWCNYEPVDAETAVILAGCDLNEALSTSGARIAHEIVSKVADQGPDQELVREVVDLLTQAMRDPYNMAMFAWRAANRAVSGLDPETPEQVLDEAANIEADDLVAPAISLRDTLMVGAVRGADIPAGMTELTRPQTWRREGNVFRHQNWPADASRVSIDSDLIQLYDETIVNTVAAKDVVGLLTYPDGVRTLVARDAWNLTIDPDEWRRGSHVAALIDDLVPTQLHLPQPAASWGDPPPRQGTVKRWWIGFRRSLRTPAALRVYIGCLVLLGLVTLARPSIATLFVGMAIYGAVRELRAVNARRRGDGP